MSDELKTSSDKLDQLSEQQQRDAKKVRQMMESEGYQLLSSVLRAHKEGLVKELLMASTLIDIQRLQSDIKAIETFLNTAEFYASIQR